MNYPHGRPEYLDEVCVNCGGERGLHNHMNQACPKDPNANRDHTEYRTTTFAAAQPSKVQEKETELETFKDAYVERNDAYNKAIQEIERLKKENALLEAREVAWQNKHSFLMGEIERLKDLLVKYEQWEADIISNDEMWWPNKAKDSLPDEIYETMLELQAERNELLKRFTPESYKK